MMKVKQSGGQLIIGGNIFFMSEARNLSPEVCLFLASLINSIAGNTYTAIHWRTGLEKIKIARRLRYGR